MIVLAVYAASLGVALLIAGPAFNHFHKETK